MTAPTMPMTPTVPRQRLRFDAAPEVLFADLDGRRIRGLAVPLGAVARSGGRAFRFARDSIRFAERTPLLQYHDTARPVGRLIESTWSDRGLEVTFAVSRTEAGDEALVLAADGVLGISVGIDLDPDGTRLGGDGVIDVHLAAGREVSLTPVPAFAGSVIDSVAMSDDRPIERTTVTVTEAPEVTTVTAPPTAPPVPTVHLDTSGLGESIAAAFAALPQAQPVPVAGVREAAPYRFDGQPAEHGFVRDMREAQGGDGAAGLRLQRFIEETFAVTSANVAPLNPATQRPDLYVGPLRYQRPLAGLISTGGLSGNTPFVVPKFASAAGLVAPHVEGVEPALGSFTATSQTATPGAVSGKVEVTREAFENSSPQIDALVWAEMLAAHAEALEERVAALLDGLSLTPITVTGTDGDVIDGITDVLVDLQFERGGARFTSFATNADLYKAVIDAKDGDGRRLIPVLAPANADGTTAASFGRFLIGTTTGVPAWSLESASYLVVPSSVWQWSSAPRRLDFDVQVKSVFVGLWGYAAEACLRDSDVKRITYTA